MPLGEGVSLKRRHQRGVPLEKNVRPTFCRYWLAYCENGCR